MRWILSLKKPMKYREFGTALAANFLSKSVGKLPTKKSAESLILKKKKKGEKNQRNTENPTQICLQIYGQKSEEKPKN